ncbi:UNVERIFIED_CONTAM: hypothetical protein FKN15_000270 [Acipenser sinensis]
MLYTALLATSIMPGFIPVRHARPGLPIEDKHGRCSYCLGLWLIATSASFVPVSQCTLEKRLSRSSK